MSVTIDGNAGVTFPAGGVGNTASATVGLTDTQTLTNKTLTSPTINSGTLSSPVISGTPTGVGVLTSGTAVASTSGTSIDFTGIPSWVKRITIAFNAVSTSGTSLPQVQLGTASGVETTGYVSLVYGNGAATAANSTTGLLLNAIGNAGYVLTGHCVITNLSGNLYINSVVLTTDAALGNFTIAGAGRKTTASTLDRVRITTVNGTDTFDAGSINILYE